MRAAAHAKREATPQLSSAVARLTSAASNHLLTGPNGSQYGLLQPGLHVLGLFEGQAVDPLQSPLPLQGFIKH